VGSLKTEISRVHDAHSRLERLLFVKDDALSSKIAQVKKMMEENLRLSDGMEAIRVAASQQQEILLDATEEVERLRVELESKVNESADKSRQLEDLKMELSTLRERAAEAHRGIQFYSNLGPSSPQVLFSVMARSEAGEVSSAQTNGDKERLESGSTDPQH